MIPSPPQFLNWVSIPHLGTSAQKAPPTAVPIITSWPILFLDLSWRAARASLIGFISRPIAKSTNSVTLWCPLITRSLTSNGSKSSAIFQKYRAVYTLSPSLEPNWLN
ncbi:hypothetical protein PGT21_006370 [Puccinia graminis f. sp. tritici]|uniref:Uncharacterized protein n=1 Tax=Puccinia graminis f. sp. tritici TaxID=56615 RepID=A0A5B0LMS7_PUCGR|nr:hypothetical protein PGT21_006370 [Puccinia graminis f. sp. tritici]KAA1129878.1 hypothetical protein PGTUg99_006795 [Puccinia graminis f. sp. tritici]